jgi:cell division protein FtsL
MIRLLIAVGVASLAVVSFGLYNGVHAAKAHQRELHALTAQIAEEAEAFRELKAEWSSLNQPERLQALARKHLALVPTNPSQIVMLASLPQRGEVWSNQTPVIQFNDLPRRASEAESAQTKPGGPAH